jgi:polyisoprenoid-binding protein YceI
MKHARLASALLASALLAASLIAVPSFAQAPAPTVGKDPATQPAGVYALDINHSSVIWSVAYSFGVANYVARFDKFEAELNFNAADPAKSAVTVSIDANSVNTNLASFNPKVAKDALGADKTPTMTFKATSLVKKSATSGTMTGDLTMNGVTKPVTFDVSFIGGAVSSFTKKNQMGFNATAKIKRSEWGSTAWAPAIGDEVTITVNALFSQKA